MNKNETKSGGACPLKPHTAKSWLTALVLGVFIGLAVIVPGVSGSTIAIIFGLYAAMLYSIGNIFNDFKRCLAFLIPIGIGVAVGFLAGFLVIQKFFGDYMFEIVCLFVGLMIGAVPAIAREIKGEKLTPVRGVLFPVGILIPIAVGALSIFLTLQGNSTDAETFTSFPIYLFILYFPLGMVVSATQIIPGLSATAILMAFGQFSLILNSLHTDYIFANPQVIGLYASIGLGFAAGLVIISRIFAKLLERRRASTFYLVTGLSFGSVISMFLNPDMWEIYTLWGSNPQGEGMVRSIIIGVVLLIVGFIPSFFLTRYELSHNTSEN